MMLVLFVGYMNVGKLMLFNVLMKVQVYVVDQLFVMFDMMLWCVYFGDEVGQIVVFDMVGFICELFYQFVVVFCVIFEEMIYVDLLLYVVDVLSVVWFEQIEQVNGVLYEIGVEMIWQVLVFNKIDVVFELVVCGDVVEWDEYGNILCVFLSVCIGQGFDMLCVVIVEIVFVEYFFSVMLFDVFDGMFVELYEDYMIFEYGC